MTGLRRLFLIFVALAVLVLIPFALWGEGFERTLSGEAARDWLAGFGGWAWAPGIALLIFDLVLPVPATAVMAGLGYVYGPFLGGLIGALGSWLSGAIAYLLCRIFGRVVARRLLGADGLVEAEWLFARVGGWLVVLSRWLPVFPEVVACMAGLGRMRILAFAFALACGSVPLAFTFAAIGHAGTEHPLLALALAALLPPLLWLAVQRHFRVIVAGSR